MRFYIVLIGDANFLRLCIIVLTAEAAEFAEEVGIYHHGGKEYTECSLRSAEGAAF
jgi:hypothetical protein